MGKTKTLEEMNYFELLDLIAWCEDQEEKVKGHPNPYERLRGLANERIKEMGTEHALEQFWSQKMTKEIM